jgi:hypothetical protein
MSRTTGIPLTYILFITTQKNTFLTQFAYHEATYFLVRLLQEFTGFTLDKSNNLQPPAEWAACEGLKGTEKVQPGAHLTMFVRVSIISFIKRTHEIKICVTDSFFFS